ncbi:uncharacterized protein DUF2271 [Pseudomonas sp. SLBN-26]|jgi:hypothetical protein|uniref:DUF2271 domain-containing protein n=1 Tax=Metapseudomonas otitidis TaxID=319939 RepID=A0A679GR40_9GAMM|nr:MULTISPECIES: DUF2271 domain-containing protein [Pseudomonas]MDL5591778.1 DUF2271 domain-containing protein [Bacillus subtilis]KIV62740.1 hypothetical protein SZ55_4633 [Pseudomonas sp. FeS53a]MBO2926145.1 DUF2271 domain-containing protein [Pseudomonas otitidis]MCO7554037.1 DUF2271 domain-containing protein [Pseudomonas otitidis]MCP1621040.1 hypothetical protein [Pseudomonas otitidis]
MNRLLTTSGLASALLVSGIAQAREVTLQADLTDYSGNDAYLAVYLTNAQGQYQQTLWVAGKKAKYYRHLTDWARGSGLKASEFDGLTGASVGSGGTLKISAEVADNLIDAGYQIRIDSAVEDHRDVRADVVVPLTRDGAGKPVSGNGYVQSLRYDL